MCKKSTVDFWMGSLLPKKFQGLLVCWKRAIASMSDTAQAGKAPWTPLLAADSLMNIALKGSMSPFLPVFKALLERSGAWPWSYYSRGRRLRPPLAWMKLGGIFSRTHPSTCRAKVLQHKAFVSKRLPTAHQSISP